MIFPSAKVVIKHTARNNEILLVERTVQNMIFYEPAGGKIEINKHHNRLENFEECAIREIKEELGLNILITKYIGSYSFIWRINPNNTSVCVLFEGIIIGDDSLSQFNTDRSELPIKPVWVNRNNIENLSIDPLHYNLKNLLLLYR